ncbi:MAG: endonuclease III [Methanobacteriales archaeon HGW-Methanobacteriales-1]|jgi:endonuclease-3 related protein|nr:MAG: endonuclease III [Methanobacteriales archaeon HGW-Methanobacteriales-1]
MIKRPGDLLMDIYGRLYSLYGPQGWWPLMDFQGENPAKTGSIKGYHPENYYLPQTDNQRFEIMMGAILTQNTAWTSAEKAIANLHELGTINPEKILNMDLNDLKEAIRCAGFLNQKSVYIQEVAKFFIALEGDIPTRKEILTVKGVGDETADSILLYAYKKPEFVVDTYTKRIFYHLGLIGENAKYHEVKKLFESNLPKEVPLFQEYHALIVEHAKRYYQKKPYGVGDPLMELRK